MEYVIVDGKRIPIPAEVVSEGRDAVAAYIASLASPQPAARPARGV